MVGSALYPPGGLLGSTASRVVAPGIELGQLEGVGIIQYCGVSCCDALLTTSPD